MDYDDNDCGGQNLHLAGEENSKISSVLQPFSLPKFDFDDSLHGHLRFDSLVENEVFLGIPSQEDNHWIEDFSRGSSGIEFNSNSTEPCALPRHDNVWSEATSSESVEMLLKAVGQEEVAPGETMVEGSDPQLGSSTKQVGDNLKNDQMDYVLEVEGCGLKATSESLHTDLKSSMDNQGDSSGLLNESLSEQEQENLPSPDTHVDNNESSSQLITESIVETSDVDKFCNSNFVNTVNAANDISVEVEVRKEEFSMNYELVGGNDSVNLDMPCHVEIPAKLGSVDHAVDACATTVGGTPGTSGKGESMSTLEGFNDACFIAAGNVDCGPAVFSSGTKIKQLPEGCDMLTEKPSSPLRENEFVAGIGIEGSKRDDLGDSADSSFNGADCITKTVVEDITNVREVAAIQEENLEQGDHVSPAMLPESMQTCRENDLSVQSVVHEGKLDASKCEDDKKLPLDSNILVSDDNEKEGMSTFSGEVAEVNLKAASTQSNNFSGDNPVLNSEVSGTILISSGAVEGDLSDLDEHDTPSYHIPNRDQNKIIESEANKESIISGTKVSFGVADEFAPAIGSEKSTLFDSVRVKEPETVDQSAMLMEASSAISFDKTSKDSNEDMEHSAPGLTVQDDVAEAAPSEKPKEAEEGKNTVENSSIVSATINAVDIDESNLLSLPGMSCTESSQGEVSKRVNLTNSESKNVGNVLSSSADAKLKTLSKEEGICTSDIRYLGSLTKSTGYSSSGLQSVPSIQASKLPVTGSVSLPTSGGTDPVILKGISHETSLMSDGVPPSGGFKASTERKSRRGSNKSVKESAKKGNQVKEKSPLRQTEKGGKSCGPLSPLLAGQLMTLDSVVKPRATVSIPGSTLPDLNTSAPISSFFQQPFTDLQQVQLRAQIFVYGSLIQGVAPDEACMVSSFGVSDGGRSTWEPSWRAVVEKLNGQKSQGYNFETPVRSSSGAKAPDQVSRQTFAGSEVLSSPAGRASNKVISSQAINPLIPLSSPLWNVSVSSCEAVPSSSAARCAGFDYPAVSPLHPYHTPPIRNLVSHTTSWQPQASFTVPWATSSQSSPFDISSSYTVFPISEPVKSAAAVKGSSSLSSGVKLVTPVPAIHTGSTALFPEASSLDLKKVAVSTTQTSANAKSRKRKKSSGVDSVLQASATATLADSFSIPVIDNRLSKKASAMEDFSRLPVSDSMPMPVVSCHYSTSIAFTSPSNSVPKGKSIQFVSSAWPSISNDHHKSGDLSMDKRAPFFEEFSKVEEAKLHAEEAAVHASAAMRHCQGLWSQLEQQKNSGLKTEAEAKLASAAVAVAAAASVAKAAAAAAKVASNAAMQAKQIADESVTKCGTLGAPECDTLNTVNNLANAIPVSILKSGDYNNTSSFVISAAKEAAKKRVEAASAATRHAENLDAIVKAAEMAAEAVSHAGKVVAMGDPFTLSQLVEAGPDGYWKVPQGGTVPGSKSNDMNNSKSDNSNVVEIYSKDMHVSNHITSPAQKELSRNVVDTAVTVEEGLVSSIKHGEKNSKANKDKRVTEPDKASGIAAEPILKSRLKSFTPVTYDNTAIIKDGSTVEVLKDRGDLKKAWFSANVLSLKDRDAFVCFTELQSDQEQKYSLSTMKIRKNAFPIPRSEQLKEWVSLEAKDGNPPTVRIPHPITAAQFEGTRKRRRAAVKDYAWSVGDKVDAWVQDCWREGIISEKNKKDTTTWSVHFPAQGETLDVKVWHLRPTVVWVDGQWIECCRSGQGDTPIEKRPKLGSNDMVTEGAGELSKTIDFAEVDKAEHRLPLSAEETVFNAGSTRVGKKPDMGRTMRSGSQKEGSRVVIGVPKPGKRRKFIEVSKHYVSDRNTKTVPGDSVKLAKFLTSQGPGSRGSKNSSKIDLKEKLLAEAKSKAPKSGKPPTVPSRILPQKDGLNSSHSNASDAAMSNDDNEAVEKSLTEFASFSNVPESAIVFSSRARSENRKKTSAMNPMPERFKKGKLAPSSGKSEKNEADENFVSGVAEPRRSIRRIQPTSRLLEGLQSSLTISKLPSSSHDKSHRSNTKNTSKGYSSRN
ncbi:protein SWOLLEN 1 isoform X2 [Henckelia pumila]|uniref:protein SWOLLEN 1 isoform X2 n=1 Tax=Henckelia pumila TaxID=405737 RepID=UPI003C6E0691